MNYLYRPSYESNRLFYPVPGQDPDVLRDTTSAQRRKHVRYIQAPRCPDGIQATFIDVTYHREEYVYTKHESGYYEKTAIRKRPGTVGICAAIMHKYGVEAVPHLICGGFTREDTENALIDLNFLDIKNVLALRGDAMTFEEKFNASVGGHSYALDLVRQIGGYECRQIP